MHIVNQGSDKRSKFHLPRLSNKAFGFFLILPTILTMGFVLGYPLVYSIYLSFHRMILIDPSDSLPFVGWTNYIRLFVSEPYFNQVLINTLLFVGIGTAGSFIVGLTLALSINEVKRFRQFLLSTFLIPYIMPTVVLSLLWMWMFNPSYGIVNYVLKQAHLIDQFKPWFSDPTFAIAPLLILYIYKGGSFHMLMLLAGLQIVPEDLYDAAKVDGANVFQRFFNITIPMLRHVIMVLVVLSAMHALQYFTPIWLLTRGGPGYNTTTLSVYVYQIAFQRYDFGLAGTVATIWLIFLLIATTILFRIGRTND